MGKEIVSEHGKNIKHSKAVKKAVKRRKKLAADAKLAEEAVKARIAADSPRNYCASEPATPAEEIMSYRRRQDEVCLDNLRQRKPDEVRLEFHSLMVVIHLR